MIATIDVGALNCHWLLAPGQQPVSRPGLVMSSPRSSIPPVPSCCFVVWLLDLKFQGNIHDSDA